MKVSALLAEIDRLAPFGLAEAWDRVGLQVGRRERHVGSVLVGLDLTDELLDEAARQFIDVLLVHHPPLFVPLETLTDDTPAGAVVLRAARDDRVVVAAHTNLDKARGGLADIACAILGLEGTAPLAPSPVDWLKLVGFVPPDDLAAVQAAVFAAGAGVIGDYEHCSFYQPGTGTFRPREGASPAVGTVGADNTTQELRLEAVFPRRLRRPVLDAFLAAHSYEEPAYDVYPVENELGSVGLGRLGFLERPQALRDVAATVARHFGQSAVRYSGDPARQVRSVALTPGSGAWAVDAVAGKADVLVTGDVKYHDAEKAVRLGLAVVDVPHEALESKALQRWTDLLAERLAPSGVSVSWYGGAGGLWQFPPNEHAVPSAHEGPGRADAGLDASPGEGSRFRLFVDGGARGNPGPAGIGVRLESPDGELVEELADAIGVATNNQAEYQALIAGLELALDRGAEELQVFADSELVVRQINGEYRVKDDALKALHERALHLLHELPFVEVRHIPREQNAEADRLVNEAIDASLKH